MSEWISVEERLPDKHENVLVWGGDTEVYVAWMVDVRWFIQDYSHPNGYEETVGVTHWMPLPEPPND